MRNFSLLLQNVYCLCGSSANEAYWIFASSKLTVLTQGNIFLLIKMVPFTAYNCAPAWIFPACRSSLHLVQCLNPAGTRPWLWLWGGRCTLPQSETQGTRWAERWWDGNEAADVKKKEWEWWQERVKWREKWGNVWKANLTLQELLDCS